MKRILILFAVLLLSILAACGDSDNTSETSSDDENGKETEEVAEEETNEKDSEVEEASEKNQDTEEVPEITEDALNHAYDIINGYDMVKDPRIEVSKEEQKITLAIQVNAATNDEHAKDLGDNFARALASGVAIYSEDDMESPSKDNLGEIYDYYDLHIGVGTDSDNFIARGAEVKSASNITW